ncbi:MAG: DUF192 domain-containing protein [Corticimicrobacter sp.]|uniref:DUF192 domain-containing protein n=1 Tax=Corticimicrobacter sp. TaxID=2678536 RepID=UPI0032DA3129
MAHLRCAVRRVFFFILLAGSGLFYSHAAPAGNPNPTLSIIRMNAGIHLIHAEVADNDATRQRGLMFRQELAPNHGMLFVYPTPDTLCFWMRNTPLPLSIAFIRDDGTIANIADMAPYTETPHCSAEPVRYALEMEQGWFATRHLSGNAQLNGLPN